MNLFGGRKFGEDDSLLFFFLLLVIIFCNCGLFKDSDELLFFFLILVVLFNNDCLCRGLVHQPVRAENAGCGKEGSAAACVLPFVVLTVLIANMEPGLQACISTDPIIGTVPS